MLTNLHKYFQRNKCFKNKTISFEGLRCRLKYDVTLGKGAWLFVTMGSWGEVKIVFKSLTSFVGDPSMHQAIRFQIAPWTRRSVLVCKLHPPWTAPPGGQTWWKTPQTCILPALGSSHTSARISPHPTLLLTVSRVPGRLGVICIMSPPWSCLTFGRWVWKALCSGATELIVYLGNAAL